MIEKTLAYTVNGTTHATLALAQVAAISDIVDETGETVSLYTVQKIVDSKDKVIAVLKLRERKARKPAAKPAVKKPSKIQPAAA